MSTSLVHQVLAEELGRDWRDLFGRFDDAPAAAASIGQVHRATWHDGRVVAVKVQYPRAGDALATDLRQLGRLVPLIRVAAPGLDARGLFSELRSQLMAEVDYQQEAAAQTSFADAFHGDADFLVPPVVEVTDRVLVSAWVEGAPVAVIARRGNQRQRRRVALLLTRFLLSSPSRVGRLHGDPHPGNFRLTDDGRLAVLDFGCSLPMPSGWPPRLEELLRAGRDLDSAALFETATATGLVGSRGVTPTALLDLLAPLLEPLRYDEFTFDRAWMRAQTLRLSDPCARASRTQRRLRMPVRHLLVQRVAAGTTGVLCLLGVPVPVLAEVAAWMPELRPPS
jgi:predicted unusual protein kinase regulating ubiquinone biosynthesis (AarF/ABC1/UbiB family)